MADILFQGYNLPFFSDRLIKRLLTPSSFICIFEGIVGKFNEFVVGSENRMIIYFACIFSILIGAKSPLAVERLIYNSQASNEKVIDAIWSPDGKILITKLTDRKKGQGLKRIDALPDFTRVDHYFSLKEIDVDFVIVNPDDKKVLPLEIQGGFYPKWSPNSQQILYEDVKGVWVVALNGDRKLLCENRMSEDPMKNGEGTIAYRVRDWFPDSQHVLVDVGYYEGGGLRVVNVETGKVLSSKSIQSHKFLSNGSMITAGPVSEAYDCYLSGLWSWDKGQEGPRPLVEARNFSDVHVHDLKAFVIERPSPYASPNLEPKKTIVTFNLASEKDEELFEIPKDLRWISWNPTTEELVGIHDNSIMHVNMSNKKITKIFENNPQSTFIEFQWTPDGRGTLVNAGGVYWVVSKPDWKAQRIFPQNPGGETSLDFHIDGTKLCFIRQGRVYVRFL